LTHKLTQVLPNTGDQNGIWTHNLPFC